MPYAIRYTISGLTGAYALKYSVVIYDAARFNEFLTASKFGFTDFAAAGDVRSYDPFEVFKGLMKTLKRAVNSEFKEPLMDLLNLCEECMAKDGCLMATQVPNDTPKPAPLFQL